MSAPVEITDWRRRAQCRESDPAIFFPPLGRISLKSVEEARSICRRCKVFEQCKEWGLANFSQIEDGIFFGVGSSERRLIDSGLTSFVDWRYEARTLSPSALEARERRALRQGVQAVTDVFRIYEIDDPMQRRAIIEAYDNWCKEQHYPSSFERAQERVAHLTAVASGAKQAPRRMAVPVQFRPECPSGCGKGDMARLGSRKPTDPSRPARTVWTCYRCRAKVVAEPADLIPFEALEEVS